MNKPAILQKIADFFLTKIIIGIIVVAGCVALVETAGRSLLDQTQLSDEFKNTLVGMTQVALAVLSYIMLFRFYEKRKIRELSLATLRINAPIGFLTGLLLQSLAIFVIYLAGGYSILKVNPVSFLLPSFMATLTAGFVIEILVRGILFRLTEEKFGTIIALIISALLFAIMHSGSKGATILSVLSTTIQAGILLSAAYIFTRSLWFSIFLHFAWDLAEPGIYGGINPGISIEKSLFASKITGTEIVTGGPFGPGNSIQAALLCLLTALLFLWLARRRNNFIRPYWKK